MLAFLDGIAIGALAYFGYKALKQIKAGMTELGDGLSQVGDAVKKVGDGEAQLGTQVEALGKAIADIESKLGG